MLRMLFLLSLVAIAGQASAESKTACLSAPGPKGKEVLNLSRSYQLALARSEDLMAREESVKAAEARYQQAIAGVFPRLNLTVSDNYRDGSSSSSSGSGIDSGDSFVTRSSGSDNNRFRTAFTVNQPIFSGFREFILSDAAKADMRAIELENERFRELLYLDVAELYFQIMLFSGDLGELGQAEDVLRQRIDELQKRVTLGKSRSGERLSAEAELQDLLAVQEQTRGLLSTTRELLAFLLGVPAEDLSLHECGPSAAGSGLETYLEKARGRSDLEAGAKRELSIQKQIAATERELWPSVSLQASHFPYEDPNEDRNYDVLLRMDVPIFDGGRVEARAQERRSELAQRRILNGKALRSAESDVRRYWTALESAKLRVKQLERSVDTAGKNYESQVADYQNGVVTNLDVLAAIRGRQEARRRLLQARVNEKLEMIRLRVAAGGEAT